MQQIDKLLRKKLRELNVQQIRIRYWDGGCIVEAMPFPDESYKAAVAALQIELGNEQSISFGLNERLNKASETPVAKANASTLEAALNELSR